MAELNIEGILEALVDGNVEFLIIGGVAVGFHGYIRATKDVDIVPAPELDNLERLASVLESLDAKLDGAEDFDSEELPDPLDPETLALGGNWVLQTQLGLFDVLQWIGGEALWEKLSPAAVEEEIGKLRVKVVGYKDLVALKELAGRGRDLEDLKNLREARGE